MKFLIKKLESFGSGSNKTHSSNQPTHTNVANGHSHQIPAGTGHNHNISNGRWTAQNRHDHLSYADLVIAFYPDGSGKIIKNRDGQFFENEDERFEEVLLKRLSNTIFKNKLKMFQQTFSEDVRKAINSVLDEHKLKVKGLNE